MKKEITALALILLLALGLRFWQLGQVPLGFHRDEAFLGYNGFSILKTGRDINANFLPLNFQSIVYSPGGYSYFTIFPIKIFGLNQFAVRFPAALLGSLTVVAIYYLTREIFPENSPPRSRQAPPRRWLTLPLVSSFLLAISPWHINLSRTATESVLILFFLVLGVCLYFSGLKKKSRLWLFLAFVCIGINLYIYLAARSFLPLFLPVLIYLSFSKIKTERKTKFFVWLLFFLMIVLPSAWFMFSKNLSLWVRSISLLGGQETQLLIERHIREDGVSSLPIIVTRLFHNKVMGYLNQFLRNYFAHFSFDFLFTDQGFPNRYRVPLTGLFYLFELPLLLIGLWTIFKKNVDLKTLLFAWLFLSMIGSALTFNDVPNLQRTLIALPVFCWLAGFGWLEMVTWLKRKRIFLPFVIVFILFGFYNFSAYLHQYYIHAPLYQPWDRQDGYQALVEKVNQLLPDYRKAVITDRESAPTIYFLFFSQYDPAGFQQETKNPAIPDFDRISFGKYQFLQEECPMRLVTDENGRSDVNGEKGVLYVNSGLCGGAVPGSRQLAEIRRADNSLAFIILEYQP